MISKTPEQRDEYISRLKYQLDEAARIEYAQTEARQEALREGRQEGLREGRQEGRQEGLQEGEKKGEVIGRIVVYQELLGLTQPTRDELSTYEISRLAELAEQLQLQLRTRGQ